MLRLIERGKRRGIGLGFGVLIVACALVAGARGADPKPGKPKSDKPKHGQIEEGLFTNSQVLRIEIEIPEQGINALRDSPQRAWGRAEKRPTVKAIVREGGTVYKDVAIHLKGAAGSFRSVDDDPALTLNFDKHVKGQTFHGLERFSLNNSVQDRSLLSEQICREMFAAAGVPAPRATHAQVKLNGRDLGVYVLTEAFNKQFLLRNFKNAEGNLYDGGFLKDVTDDLEKSSGGKPDDRSDLRRLADAAQEKNLTNRYARLSRVLDVDRFLNYLALDMLMCNWDGYGLNRNNYRVYHDPDSDKMVFMPHGLDQMFGVMRAGTDMPIMPQMQGLVARALLQTAEGRQEYRKRIRQLMDSVYDAPALTNRAWQLAAQIRPVLQKEGAGMVQSHEGEVRALCSRIVRRARNVREQLEAPDKALKFDSSGFARFTDWKSRVDFGKPAIDETTEGGRKLLHIAAGAGSAVGVWTTRVRLEPGKYRFEGKVKSRGVVPDPGDRKGGAGLRVSDRRFAKKLTGDAEWTDFSFDFEVQNAGSQFGFMSPIQEDAPETDLLCELRAAKGEAWFDRDSLRLVKP